VRRLIFIGEDTASNFQLLFGPNWAADIAEIHKASRLEILLDPPPGSPCYILHARNDQAYIRPRSVRPADEDEAKTVQEVRKYQDIIAARYPPGSEIPSNSVQQFIPMLGPDWPSKLELFTLAQNTMDQGVRGPDRG
jgi:hypothetical protein